MPLFKDPFDHSYEDLGVNDLIATVDLAAAKAEVHIAFQGAVSEYVCLPPALRELSTKLGQARDSGNDAALKAAMAAAVRALRFNASHITLMAQHRNDPSLLQNASYTFKPEASSKPKMNLVDLIPDFSLKHMKGVSGAYVIVLARAKIGAIVELQWTETPDVESSWRGIGEGTFNKSRIEVRGCEPTKRIWVRGRYHEDGAVGHWSPAINIIIL